MTDHFITTPIRAEMCTRCDTTVLRGVSGGLDIKADPDPLDYSGELAVLHAGRVTYDLVPEGHPRRLYLEHRGPERIKKGYRHTVVAHHFCRKKLTTRAGPIPDPVPIVIRPPRPEYSDNPPF